MLKRKMTFQKDAKVLSKGDKRVLGYRMIHFYLEWYTERAVYHSSIN